MDNIHPPEYSLKNSPKERAYKEIGRFFISKYGSPPAFYARVPGRVNLIGEHIDYCGFSVLPMAIDQDIVLAVGLNDTDKLNLANFYPEMYEDFSSSAKDLHIDTSSPRWYHYILCGFQGMDERFSLPIKGFNIVVKGNIPPCAGLSSSSALVCATALSLSFANRVYLTKDQLASVCAYSERYIGTQGGGMDQAIGFLAERGTAMLIDFNPLKATKVPLPKGVVFVVSNSCVEINKAASSQFNLRVVECRLAAKVLAKLHGLEWQSIKTLSEIPILLRKTLEDITNVVESCIPHQVYTRADICSILGVNDTEFASLLSKNTQHVQTFKINQRAKHVYQEAARVMQFKFICDNTFENAVQELGLLMNQSHESCRDLYECSHPDLDELVSIALEAGAIGSRLTGAGWGGCCVSLVMESKVYEFMNILKKRYYENKPNLICRCSINNAIFASYPSSGAALYSY